MEGGEEWGGGEGWGGGGGGRGCGMDAITADWRPDR